MANTSTVSATIDADLKENAESILAKLGISASNAIQMLYSQIVLTRGIPFPVQLPCAEPTAIGGMSREELDAELMKGMESLKTGKAYTPDEVAELLRRVTVSPIESK